MKDTIYRQDAIDAVKFYETQCDPYPRVIESLQQLPSAEQNLQSNLQSNLQPTCNQLATDCISRQGAIDAICTWDKFGVDERGRLVRWYEGLEPYVHLRDVVFAIEKLPSAESETIYCKDCKHWYPDADTGMACEFTNMSQPDDGFCNWAERRTDEGFDQQTGGD